jgi:hypothetical protein
VTFAGALPHRRAAGVTVNCGAWTATYLRLASVAVRRGEAIAVGDRLGHLGVRGLHLGARRTGRRWDYVDPLALLARDPDTYPGPLVPVPRWRIGPGPLGAPARPSRSQLPLPLRWSAPAAAAARPVVPLVAWLGLALLAGALPALGIQHTRRRRRQSEAARSRHAPPDAA